MNYPPVYFDPDFLSSHRELLAQLLSSVKWDERMKARKTASIGVSYDYSQMSYDPAPMPVELYAVANRIQETIGFLPNNCLLNYYEDGSSSMGFHSDSCQELAAGTGVAIVSLGSTRSLVFRKKSDRSMEFDYPLPPGSLIYMTKEVQDHWLHAIQKTENVGLRISLTFRSIIK
jgi:alkylated DNA repair dioxygenase AlkB